MIESHYWRVALREDIRWLRQKQKYKRWSEGQLVLFERKLMLVAFQVRTLLERPKVNDKVRGLEVSGIAFPKIGNRPFTVVGAGSLEDRFDLTSPRNIKLSVWDLTNQFIHYYWMQTSSTKGRFESVLVFSDYKRHVCAFEFEIADLIKVFGAFSADDSAISECDFVWDEKKQDYLMKNARG